MMKNNLLISGLLLIFSFNALSQEYQKVDKIVDAYPRSFSKIEKLADQINKDFNSEKDKARAIYRWVAMNVKYDVDAYFKVPKPVTYSYSSQEEKERKEMELEKDMAEQVLKKKKAVCQGYSTLFKMLCDLTKVECVVIQGHSKIFDKDIGKVPKISDHAWNAVKIDNKWRLVDATWGAGSVDYSKKEFIPKYSDVYFFTSPELFFLKHYPENKEWLLVDKTIQDFADLPLYYTDVALEDIAIIKPQKGIISIKGKDKIEFKWKTNLNPKDLNYAFRGDKYGKEIISEYKDGILSFEIKMEKAVSTFLTFYYKGVSVITYKIEKK